MSLHNKPEYNTPEIVAALRAHGLDPDQPNVAADAFRLGWAARDPDWVTPRCAECDCEFGGADCNWIKSPAIESGQWGDA